MSPDIAETALAAPPRELSIVALRSLRRALLDAERMAAARDVWRALWSSRLLVWAAGVVMAAAFGFARTPHAFDPAGVARGFGALGDLLVAPASRWDSAWYLAIAHSGYRADLGAFADSRTAFFPLYPLGVRVLSDLGPAPVLAGVLLSLAAFAAALYGLHRLTVLELGGVRASETARLTVLLTAFAPMAFYFSAVYSESLYMALSVGVFLCARRGQWAAAAVLAALAGATRNTGVALALPMALFYLYGPREDRRPDHPGARGLHPRYRVRRDALWLALVPAGLGLYMAHLALAGGDPLAPFNAQAAWSRHLAGPFGGVWQGTRAAFEGLRQLLSLQSLHIYYPLAGGSPFIDAGHNLMLFAFLLAAIPAVAGVLRLLPPAYGVYVLAALALPLSYPPAPQPLMSLPRFLVVLFPLNMWLAARLATRPRVLASAALTVSALAMMFFVGEFATWHWVA
jgi:hypothetical protein